jgi:hypothetical protein
MDERLRRRGTLTIELGDRRVEAELCQFDHGLDSPTAESVAESLRLHLQATKVQFNGVDTDNPLGSVVKDFLDQFGGFDEPITPLSTTFHIFYAPEDPVHWCWFYTI